MNKTDLIDAVATESGLSKSNAKLAVDAIVKTTMQALKEGDKVSLIGFGSWMVSIRESRTGRNPRTGEQLIFPEKKVIRFKPGKEFTDFIQ